MPRAARVLFMSFLLESIAVEAEAPAEAAVVEQVDDVPFDHYYPEHRAVHYDPDFEPDYDWDYAGYADGFEHYDYERTPKPVIQKPQFIVYPIDPPDVGEQPSRTPMIPRKEDRRRDLKMRRPQRKGQSQIRLTKSIRTVRKMCRAIAC